MFGNGQSSESSEGSELGRSREADAANPEAGRKGGDELERLVVEWVDGRISEGDASRLEQILLSSPSARKVFRSYCKLDVAMREIAEGASIVPADQSESAVQLASSVAASGPEPSVTQSSAFGKARLWGLAAVAAAAIFLVGTLSYQVGRLDPAGISKPISSANADASLPNERILSGYATLRRAAEIQWAEGANWYRAGDVLPSGLLELRSGMAEIDFFCGATVVVEGPAKLELESDWSVRLLSGTIRANVPPPARGFVVKAADSEIIDLGTEFALRVEPDDIRVEVIEGEIELRGGESDGKRLVTGQGQSLLGTDGETMVLDAVTSIEDIRRLHDQEQLDRYELWKEDARTLSSDPRLIAYYPMVESQADRTLSNHGAGGSLRDAALVGPVEKVEGRFGPLSAGLSMHQPGSRARVLIDGEFEAFTFATWVKIDNLEHRYNALFMGDGYDNGEPHWQIRDDGRLMFSVMVDDSADLERFDTVDQRVVKMAGLHKLYFTEPIWDLSQAGKWLHIAAVYNPAGREVIQYVNGQVVGRESIRKRFYVEKLRIGSAELGNWGQPFRKSPWFAVRNLNGTMDELVIFNAALGDDEIQQLYEQGKPLGY